MHHVAALRAAETCHRCAAARPICFALCINDEEKGTEEKGTELFNADDFVVCFRYKVDAERFHMELGNRLGRFGLEIEPTKTKVMEFGRFAIQNASRRGRKAETFDFLGFTHYCSTKRDGKGFRMKRVTARKKFVAKLKIFKDWLKKARIMKTKDLWETAKAKLIGHYNYYGVTDNFPGITRFFEEVKKLLFKWLNRRGKRNCINWEKFNTMLERFPLPKPRIRVSMFSF